MSRAWLLLGVLLLACRATPPSPPVDQPKPPAAAGDSLALTIGPTLSVWFTDQRQDKDSAGTVCVERVLQIRRDSVRTPVPLLYTGRAPVVVNDSTIEAELWLHCRVMDRYRVDLHSGRPTRVAR